MKSPFIRPCVPKSAASPPLGNDWLHEVKFDGFRVQIHIVGGVATLFVTAFCARTFPALRSMDRFPTPSTRAAAGAPHQPGIVNTTLPNV